MCNTGDIIELWVDDEVQRTTFHVITFHEPVKPGNHVKWCRVDAPRGPVLATIALDQGREISPVTFHIKDPGNLTVEAPKRRIIIRNIKQYGADRILLSSTSKATSLPPQNNDGISSVYVLSFMPPIDCSVENTCFIVLLEITEPEILLKHIQPFPYGLLYKMADLLRSPIDGDVQVDCPSNDSGDTRSLYAHSTILKARCDYYTRMFASAFCEGDSATTANSSVTSNAMMVDSSISGHHETPFHRRIIGMEEDFNVVHNILYYIYTNRIKLSTVHSDSEPEDSAPKTCDPEEIYALAHRLDLVDLKTITLEFLNRSCNLQNITSRVFGRFAYLYEEVGQVYDEYFKQEWEQIRTSNEFKEFFVAMEEENDTKEIIRIFQKFRELVQEANFP